MYLNKLILMIEQGTGNIMWWKRCF